MRNHHTTRRGTKKPVTKGAFGSGNYLVRRERWAAKRKKAFADYQATRKTIMEKNAAAMVLRNKWYRRLWRWIKKVSKKLARRK